VSDTTSENNGANEEKPAKKLSPLEAKKQLQAQQRQGLMKKSQGVNAVRDSTGTTAGSEAPPARLNAPRRQGGS
jgi:hypothetical protein